MQLNKKRIFVLSRADVNLIYPIHDFVIITIRSPKQRMANIKRLKEIDTFIDCLPLVFYDAERLHTGVDVLFNEKMAREILNFLEKHKNINLIYVNCEAGISRSSGVAAALSKIYNGIDDKYFDSRKYIPNMLVYSTIIKEAFSKYGDLILYKE